MLAYLGRRKDKQKFSLPSLSHLTHPFQAHWHYPIFSLHYSLPRLLPDRSPDLSSPCQSPPTLNSQSPRPSTPCTCLTHARTRSLKFTFLFCSKFSQYLLCPKDRPHPHIPVLAATTPILIPSLSQTTPVTYVSPFITCPLERMSNPTPALILHFHICKFHRLLMDSPHSYYLHEAFPH